MQNIESFSLKMPDLVEEAAVYDAQSPNESRTLAIKEITALAGKEGDFDFEQQCVTLGNNLLQTFSSIDDFCDFLAFDPLIDSIDTAYITGRVLWNSLIPLQRETVANQLANSFAVAVDTRGDDRGIRTLILLSYVIPAAEYWQFIVKLLKQSSNPEHRDIVKKVACLIIKVTIQDPNCKVNDLPLDELVPYLCLDELEPIIREAKTHSQQLACRLIAATLPEQRNPLPPFIIDVLISVLGSSKFGDVLLAIATRESIAKNDKDVQGVTKALAEHPNLSDAALMNLVWLQNSKLFLDIMAALPPERLEELVPLVAILFVPVKEKRVGECNRDLAVRWLIMLSPELFKRVMESWRHLMQQKGLVETTSAGKLAKIPNKVIVGWDNHFKTVIHELREAVPCEDMVRKIHHFGWVIIQSPDKRSATIALEMTRWLSVRVPDQYVSFATYCLNRATAKWTTHSPQILIKVNVSCAAIRAPSIKRLF